MYDSKIKKTDRIKILYVDDSEINLQLFLKVFRIRFDIIVVEFGQAGLEILKKNKDIDVVISDFNMPLMNGLEFIEEARKIKKDVPYYLFSSSLETDEIKEALQHKLIDCFFSKPLDENQILNEIYNYYDYRKELKKMHKFLIIISCLIIITSCNSSNKPGIDVGTVVIKGNIEKMDESSAKVISLSYSCSTDRCDYGTAIVDSNGNFRFEFEVLHAQDVLLHYQKGYTKLFVQPSDSLVLSLNALNYKNERFPDYFITGSNAHISKEILNYLRYRTINDFSPELENKSVEDYLNDLRHHIFREDSVLAAYNKRYNPSSTFKLWAGKNIIYSNANYLLDFKFYHQVNKSTYEGELFDTNLFPINDDEAFVSSWYDYHLKSYSYMGFQNDTLIKKLYNDEKYSSAYRLVLSKIIENEESGISRDLMCYRLLSELLKKSFSEYLRLSDDVNKFLNNKELIALLDKRKARFESRDNYHISSFDPETQEEKEILGDIFKDLEDRHKDKVMYLDIWATWCGPCKNEIPYAIELHNFYKNKEIVFVNLCLSSDKNEWKETIKSFNIGGENYYFDRIQSELLTNKLKFSGFPTYMIIDKNGNVVDDDAPRPSSNEIIKEKLNKLLLE